MEALLLHRQDGTPVLVNWENVIEVAPAAEGVYVTTLEGSRHYRESLDDLMRIIGQPRVLGDR